MKRVLNPVLLLLVVSLLHSQDRGLSVMARTVVGDQANIGRQIGVFIAINNYQTWLPLMNPVRDAKEIHGILKHRYFLDESHELYNESATKAEIFRLFSRLIEDVKPDDSIFIYYAGHGYLDTLTNTGFWIPVDGGTDMFQQENWIPNMQVKNLISRLKSRHVFLVSDSCFSGDILSLSRGMAPAITDEYFKNAYARIARQAMTSGALESVPDVSEFSRQIKVALEGNTRPCLDPLMLFSEIRLGMQQSTPMLGTLRDSNAQEGGSFLFFLKEGNGDTAGAQGATTTDQPVWYGAVAPARETVSESVASQTKYGFLNFNMVPRGHRVYVNNEYVGTTPLNEIRFPAGSMIIRLEHEDHTPLTQTLILPVDSKFSVLSGDRNTNAVILENKTIGMSLFSKADEWDGLVPIWDPNNVRAPFLGSTDLSFSRIWMCTDDRKLYWKVEFPGENPFKKLPGQVNTELHLGMNIMPPGRESYDLTVIYSKKSTMIKTQFGKFLRTWSLISNSAVTHYIRDHSVEGSIPLTILRQYARGVLPVIFQMYHVDPNYTPLPGLVKTEVRYIDLE